MYDENEGAAISNCCEIVENCEFTKNCQSWFPVRPGIRSMISHSRRGALYDSSVRVDFAVELGRDDPTLEIPWEDSQAACRYLDLKRYPELLGDLPEGLEYPELREFLGSVNSDACFMESAKCDVWSTTEMNPEEDIFEAAWKFGSYVDLLFEDLSFRVSFDAHERLVQDLTRLLKKAPEIPASAEFLIRRCYSRQGNATVSDMFYVTFYLFGYAENKEQARKQWAIALKLVENATRQLSMKREV